MLFLLTDVKRHLRIDGDADDTLLELYLEAAMKNVRAFTNQPWPDDAEVPASVQVALLLLVGDLYENREAQTAVTLRDNKTVERLLWPYRVWA